MNPRYSRYYTFIRPIIRNKTIKTYSSLTFSLIAIVIFFIFAIKPTVSTILILRKSIQQQKQVSEKLTIKSQHLAAAKENLAKIDPNILSKLNNLLPSKTDPISLTDNLASLASQNQASISGLQIQPTDLVGEKISTKNGTIQEIDFSLNAIGDYTNLVTFLDSLKNSHRLISVDSVNLSHGTDTSSLIMSINGKAFFLTN